jgi:hypothetical protein
MRNQPKTRKKTKIMTTVILSLLAGGLTKHFLFPSDINNAHAKSNVNNSQPAEHKQSSLIDEAAKWCPDCKGQVEILKNLIKKHPEAINTFKKHFDKLTKEDLQELIKKLDIPKAQDDLSNNYDSIKEKAKSLINSGQLSDKFESLKQKFTSHLS